MTEEGEKLRGSTLGKGSKKEGDYGHRSRPTERKGEIIQCFRWSSSFISLGGGEAGSKFKSWTIKKVGCGEGQNVPGTVMGSKGNRVPKTEDS